MADIIDLIDGAIRDEGFEGAMRWTPEPEPTPPREDRETVAPGQCRIRMPDGSVLYEGPIPEG